MSPELILKACQKKGEKSLSHIKSADDPVFRKLVCVSEQTQDLRAFLACMAFYMPFISNDRDIIKEFTQDFVKQQYIQGFSHFFFGHSFFLFELFLPLFCGV